MSFLSVIIKLKKSSLNYSKVSVNFFSIQKKDITTIQIKKCQKTFGKFILLLAHKHWLETICCQFDKNV